MTGTRSLFLVAIAACAAGPPSSARPGAPREVELPPVLAPTPELVEKVVTIGGFAYAFRASRLANLIFQLDCLAGVTPNCSRADFERLWAKELGGHDGDPQALAAWKELRTRYGGQIENGTQIESPLPLPRGARGIDRSLRLAAYGARDLDELAGRFALFVDPPDAARARAVVERFAPRFEGYWASRVADLTRAVDGYVALVSRPEVAALEASVARFYQLDLANMPRQTFELIACPSHDHATHAEQVEDRAFVEVRPEERLEESFPGTLMHELAHAWFAGSSVDHQLALAKRFAESGDALALPAYGLLNEVLATAVGSGVFQRAVDRGKFEATLKEPGAFYVDAFIDPVSKALLPKVDAWLAAGKTVYDDDFVDEYLRVVHAVFPAGMPPVAFLRPMVGIYDPAMETAHPQLERVARSGSSYTTELDDDSEQFLLDRPMWGAAVLLSTAEVSTVAGWSELVDKRTRDALRASAAKRKPFVFTKRRSKANVLFVFVAEDAAAMARLIDAFATQAKVVDGAWSP